MKTYKQLVVTLIVLAVVLASSISAFAIDFSAEEVYNSVFVVYSGRSMGSGFAIGENCIITNAHVIADQHDVKIETYGGELKRAFVVAMDEQIDIAVMGVTDASFTPLQVADLSTVGAGDDVYAIGAPNSLAFTLTKGVISSKERDIGKQKYIQTDAAINSGNSGGPLLDNVGKVIGVNSYKMSDAEGIGLAIPIDVVVSYLDTREIELNESGNVAKLVDEASTTDIVVSEPAYEDVSPVNQTSIAVPLLAVCLIASVALNIVLVVIMCQKRKNRCIKDNPSERTDFEIDILD